MKDLFIVANWKAHKTQEEAIAWLSEIKNSYHETNPQQANKAVVVCPPYPLIPVAASFIRENEMSLYVGSQDVSVFASGAYTGEVPAITFQKFADFCIVGHSERRQHFSEGFEILSEKVANALDSNMMPIFCVQNEATQIPSGVTLVAYEPIAAIGTGNPETPEDAEQIAKNIKEKNSAVKHVLYGGSVNYQNVASFLDMPNINGVLIGGASLDASEFIKILQAC
jgi:triosephosphate isomerase